MANPNSRTISGFKVSSFLVKTDTIKLVLEVDKSDLRVSDGGDVGDLLTSLELHSTGESEVELILAKVG